MFPTIEQATNALRARRNGEWDNADLMQFGELSDYASDVRRIERLSLEAYGYKIGPRDPRINSDYPGAFMVVESHEESELPTRDGSNGPWCIVGDDLPALLDEAFSVLAGLELDGTSGQDRDSYSDDQDRESYIAE